MVLGLIQLNADFWDDREERKGSRYHRSQAHAAPDSNTYQFGPDGHEWTISCPAREVSLRRRDKLPSFGGRKCASRAYLLCLARAVRTRCLHLRQSLRPYSSG